MILGLLRIEPVTDTRQIPFDLLERADPSAAQVKSYVKNGSCFVAKLGDQTIGVMVLKEVDTSTIEIKNIAVRESTQGKGFGKALLRYAEKVAQAQNFQYLMIGTGNSSIGALALYQKEGFEIKRIEQDFFLRNYLHPIFEHGIQCKHLIILEKRLTK